MDKELISTLAPYVSTFVALLSALLVAFLGYRSSKKLEALKKQTLAEIEHLKLEIKLLDEGEQARKKYSFPLLKVSEDLYSKLNDVVQNHEKVLPYFKSLTKELDGITSVSKILSSPVKIYVTSMLYLFARFFESVEIIKVDVGFLQLATSDETKAIQLRIRQTVTTLSSNRLTYSINLREPNSLKYHGKILEGAQILIGEWMMKNRTGTNGITNYYDFCAILVSDKDAVKMLSPIIDFLSDIQAVSKIDVESKNVDFRWAKIIYFSHFLRELIRQIDRAKAVELLPELEIIETKYWSENPILKENLLNFKKAYPDP